MSLQSLLDTGEYFTDKGRFTQSSKYYDVSKVDLHNYVNVYEDMFDKYKNSSINFLEIGIFMGGSMKLWRDYFLNANIYGIDIELREKALKTLENKDVHIYKTNSLDTKSNILNNTFKDISFDIIVDDGNHSYESQLKTYLNYYPKLKKGGLYVIEDIEPRTMNNPKFLKEFTEKYNFDVIDLREQDNRNDSVLFVKTK